MHGVRTVLVEQQAESIGLPLITVRLPGDCPNQEYASIMETEMLRLRDDGVSAVVFGDVFLEDIRKYREENLARVGMRGIFPLWKRNTRELAGEFIRLGFKAIVTCIDSQAMNRRYTGRIVDQEFLDELPATVDPCGENGEYHSFVFDGPLFRERVPFSHGEIVRRGPLYFHDLLP